MKIKSPADFHRMARNNERIRKRLARAVFHLEMPELKHIWAIASAHRDGWPIRNRTKQAGLGPTRCG